MKCECCEENWESLAPDGVPRATHLCKRGTHNVCQSCANHCQDDEPIPMGEVEA